MGAQQILSEINDPQLSILREPLIQLKYREIAFSVMNYRPGGVRHDEDRMPHCHSKEVGVVKGKNHVIAVLRMMNAIDRYYSLHA